MTKIKITGQKLERVFIIITLLLIALLVNLLQNYQKNINKQVYLKNIKVFTKISTLRIREIYLTYYNTDLYKIYDALNLKSIVDNINLESLIIFDSNWEKKFDLNDFYSKKKDLPIFISSYEKDYHNIQKQKVLFLKDNSEEKVIIINPIQNYDGEKLANIYYIFNYSKAIKSDNMSKSILAFFILSFALVIILFTFLYKNHQINQIMKIKKYIGNNLKIISSNKHNILESIDIVYPYSFLQRKIVFLITQYNEMYKNSIKLSEKNNQLIDNSPVAILILNDFGNIIYGNNKSMKLFGFENINAMLETSFLNFFKIKVENKKIKDLINNIKAGEEQNFYAQITTIDNRNITIVSNIYRPKDNDIVLCYLFDITELVKLEMEEKKLLKNKTAIIDNIDDSLIEYDDNFIVHNFNFKFQALFNKTSKELKNKNIIESFSDDKELSQLFENITLYEYNKLIRYFSSSLNKWLLIRNNKLIVGKKSLNVVSITDISSIMGNYVFYEMIVNELDGFIYIKNYEDKIIFISNSFKIINGYDNDWFIKNQSKIIFDDKKIKIKTLSEELNIFNVEKTYLTQSRYSIFICLREYEN